MVATYVPGPHGPMVFSSTAGGTASIAFVNAADGGNTTATSLTFSYTTGSGTHRLLVVGLMGDSTSDLVTGATYAGSAMTLAQKLAPGGGGANRWTYLYWLLNPTSGANNVVISASSSTFIGALAADYTGVKTSGQPDATPVTNAGGAAITTLTTSLTTVADNSWVILLENSYSGGPPSTAGSGATRRTFDAAFGAIGLFDSNGAVHPAGSYSMTTNRGSGVSTINHILESFSPG